MSVSRATMRPPACTLRQPPGHKAARAGCVPLWASASASGGNTCGRGGSSSKGSPSPTCACRTTSNCWRSIRSWRGGKKEEETQVLVSGSEAASQNWRAAACASAANKGSIPRNPRPRQPPLPLFALALSLAHRRRPAPCARSRCTTRARASTASPLIKMSSRCRSACLRGASQAGAGRGAAGR